MSEPVRIMEVETINRLFLELAQFTTAETPRERTLAAEWGLKQIELHHLRGLIRDLLPWLKEPGLCAPTARREYQAVLDRVQRALAKAD